MEAIKQTHIKRVGNLITVVVPDSFTAEEVDILIWPSTEKAPTSHNSLTDELLQWPVMTDEELAAIEEKRKHLNAWK